MNQLTVGLRRGVVVIPTTGEADNTTYALTVQASLMALGFSLSKEAFAAACAAPDEWLVKFHQEAIPFLQELVGAKRDYKPMYKNFPDEVMEMSARKLFENALAHYFSNGKWEPTSELKKRGFAFEKVELKEINLITQDEFNGLFTKLVGVNQALTPQDREVLEWFLRSGLPLVMPAQIPFKETLCMLAARGLDVPVKTATDVLRIATHMSDGDISLPALPKTTIKAIPLKNKWGGTYSNYFVENIKSYRQQARDKAKFRRFTRPERRHLLALLEKTGADRTEMQARLGRWLRLGERLHPGEFTKQFPKVAEAFKAIRNQKPRVRTFNGRVDLAFQKSMAAGVDLLATRPGEFARRLDWMLRSFGTETVVGAFGKVAPKISAKVLFEMHAHFSARDKAIPRSVMLKGRGAKMQALPELPALPKATIKAVQVAIQNALLTKIQEAKLSPLGKVWIDPRLRDVPAPAGMRSVNSGIKTYIRGTRLPFKEDANTIRSFIHWYDGEGYQDIDLSAAFYGEKLEAKGHISFTNLRETELGAVHSGDIRHRKGSCAEYIDIDIEKARKNGVRYVMLSAYNYNGKPMHSCEDIRAGFMERSAPKSNEIFEPKTVVNAMALANESTSVMMFILDLKDRVAIWADVESDRALAIVENTKAKSSDVIKRLIAKPSLSVGDVMEMHALTRGGLGSYDDADTRFKFEDYVTDYVKVAGLMAV